MRAASLNAVLVAIGIWGLVGLAAGTLGCVSRRDGQHASSGSASADSDGGPGSRADTARSADAHHGMDAVASEPSVEPAAADGGLAGADAGAVDASAADADPDPPPPDLDVDSLPWTVIGFGVAYKDTGNPLGENVFIGYAGYQVDMAQSQAWVTAFYRAFWHDRGVRYLYAVQGPRDVTYSSYEIQNTHLVSNMLPTIGDRTQFIAVAAHSSGSYVAHELFGQLFQGGYDPNGLTRGRIVYYDLDGAQGGLNDTLVGQLRRCYFVSAHSQTGDTSSLNSGGMQQAARAYPNAGGYLEYDASQSGCNAGASLCLHMTMITTRPHNPGGSDGALDYTDFVDRPVNTWYVEATAEALGR